VVTKSNCQHNLKKTSECDWIKKTCTDYLLEPGIGGIGGGPVDDVVLDGGPRRTEPVLDPGP
jgi:hypothetical protein